MIGQGELKIGMNDAAPFMNGLGQWYRKCMISCTVFNLLNIRMMFQVDARVTAESIKQHSS
jgi:hypothetical protein